MKSTAHPRVIERGILTSAYKREIRQNISDIRGKSIFRIKSSIFNTQRSLESQTAATILRVSLFTIALVSIVF